MEFYEPNLSLSTEIDSKGAKTEMMNALYKVCIHYFENLGENGKLTDDKIIDTNGHHLSQHVCEFAGELWDKNLKDKK